MQILAAIRKHGYTLEQVATMLGITKGSLSATINGSPNVKKLIDIALKIGCSPAEFFDDWYDNEGREQQRGEVRGKMDDVRGKMEEERGKVEEAAPSPDDDLPFGEDGATKQEPEQKLELTPDFAFICPHCHEAIKLGFVK